MNEEQGQKQFVKDVQENKGYYYATNSGLSSLLAHQRITDMVHALLDYKGRKVLDVGCGDGTYTVLLYDQGKPGEMCAVDVAAEIVDCAREKAGQRRIDFQECSAYELSRIGKHFDIAHLRAILHHLDHPALVVRGALSVADRVIIAEPNGYNLGLKIIERLSPYHRAHGERSYAPHTIDRWVRESGGKVVSRCWAGFVPCFCPDWLAKFCKWLEPFLERTPLINQLMCSIYYVVAERENKDQ